MRFYKLFNTAEQQEKWAIEMKKRNKNFRVCFHSTPQKEGLNCEQKFMTVYCFCDNQVM